MRTQRDWPQRHCARDASFAPLRDGCLCNDEEPPIIPKDCTRKPLPPAAARSFAEALLPSTLPLYEPRVVVAELESSKPMSSLLSLLSLFSPASALLSLRSHQQQQSQ